MAFFSYHFLSPRILFTAAIILASVYGATGIMYRLFLFSMSSATIPRSHVVQKTPGAKNTSSLPAYTVISEKNIFRVQGNALDHRTKIIPVTPTAGGLRLIGVLWAKDRPSRAVLKDSSGKQHLVKTGDRIADMTVVTIQHNTIIIRSNGSLVSLVLDQKESSTGASHSATSGAARGIRQLDRNMVTQQMANIQNLLSQVRISPHFTPDGRPAGLRLTHIQPTSIMQEIGLKQNDIIRSINNTPVHAPKDIAAFYDTFQNGESITLSVLRNGRITTLTFRIR